MGLLLQCDKFKLKCQIPKLFVPIPEELGLDKRRILDWAFACAVISLLWFLEDEDDFKKVYVQNAYLLNEISF